MEYVSVDFKHLQQIETLCPSFEVVVEFRIRAEVNPIEHAVLITSIQACVSSVYQQGPIWEEITVPVEPMSHDNWKMMTAFRRMARNEAERIKNQSPVTTV